MQRIPFPLLFFLLLGIGANAQIFTPLNLSLRDEFMINPTYLNWNLDSINQIDIGHKDNLINVNDNPQTSYLSLRKIGLEFSEGVYFISDHYGPFQHTRLGLALSYKFKVRKTFFSLGLTPNYSSFGINYSRIKLPNQLTIVDPILIDKLYTTKSSISLSPGIMVLFPNNLHIAYANHPLTDILPLTKGSINIFSLGWICQKKPSRYTAWNLFLPYQKNNYNLLEANAKYKSNIFWGSLSTFTTVWRDFQWNSIIAKTGLELDDGFNLGIAYTHPLEKVSGVNINSYEVSIGYSFQKSHPTILVDAYYSGPKIRNADRIIYYKPVKDSIIYHVDTIYYSKYLKSDTLQSTDTIEYNIFFDFDNSNLSVYAKSQLNQLMNRFENTQGLSLALYGYADQIGSEEYNLELSNKRLSAVKKYLLEHGLDESRVYSTEAIGKPLSFVDDKKQWLNRKVVIKIIQ